MPAEAAPRLEPSAPLLTITEPLFDERPDLGRCTDIAEADQGIAAASHGEGRAAAILIATEAHLGDRTGFPAVRVDRVDANPVRDRGEEDLAIVDPQVGIDRQHVVF